MVNVSCTSSDVDSARKVIFSWIRNQSLACISMSIATSFLARDEVVDEVEHDPRDRVLCLTNP